MFWRNWYCKKLNLLIICLLIIYFILSIQKSNIGRLQRFGARCLPVIILLSERRRFDISEKANPVSTRRRFDVDTTLFGRQQRCYNVETTSCSYNGMWASEEFQLRTLWFLRDVIIYFFITTVALFNREGRANVFFEG